MLRFDSEAAFQPDERLLDRAVDEPIAASRRASRKTVEARRGAPNPLLDQAFPKWARLASMRTADADAAFGAAFATGAGLALLDQILRANPSFAGALRQRLALRAATACASIARHREDERGLRDAEYLAAASADPGPAGRLHRLWRRLTSQPTGLDAERLRMAADLLGLPQTIDIETLAGALKNLARENRNPLAAAALAGSATLRALADAPRLDAEILALWLADLMLAARLGWTAPVPLLATAITHASLRTKSSGKRPRPDDADWGESCAKAYALAAYDAHALACDLSRRADKLLSLLPKLRAKGASRVIELLLSDDAVSPARAAKSARLSDRAARRLFDRLCDLGALRELSGRPSFRLYGL
jgi:hypothetical protein